MATYTVRRLLGLIPDLFGITLVVFLLMQLIPGDVAQTMFGLTVCTSAGGSPAVT